MTEFELIRRFFTRPTPGTVLGVGDDAALVRVRAGMELAISVDLLLEGRHFFPNADPERLGHKALAVNLSDMAAMGAKPRWVTLGLALQRADARWLEAFARGFLALARKHRVDLIGGDTTRGPLAIAVQIMGEVPRGKALLRDGARVGDDVWVSGELGAAALAVAAAKGEVSVPARERAALEARLDAPVPRIALGAALRGVAHSAIDISDGLLADLGHICERSDVAAVLQWESLPAALYVRAQAQRSHVAVRAILAGGDDYELCFTAPHRRRSQVMAAGRRARTPVMLVGRIERSRGGARVTVLDSIGKPLKVRLRGYTISAESGAASPGLRFVLRHPAHFIAFSGGIGLVPFAPGTFGTLIALPIFWYAGPRLEPEVYLAALFVLFVLGVWACGVAGRALGRPDYGGMVWDETVAFLLVLFFTPADPYWQAFAFLVFRAFDIVKPPPIRYYERMYKGGFGVMLDDILAAFCTLLVLALARYAIGS